MFFVEGVLCRMCFVSLGAETGGGNPKRDLLTYKRDLLTYKRDLLTHKRDLLTYKRDLLTFLRLEEETPSSRLRGEQRMCSLARMCSLVYDVFLFACLPNGEPME